MNYKNICVIGGSGFVGRHIVHCLVEKGCNVRVPTRNRERAKELIVLPTVDVVSADVHDAGTLERLLSGMDAVVNLVGVLHEGSRERSFDSAHVQLPKKIAAAARSVGVTRFLHMSALHADPEGPSVYLRTKGLGQREVLQSGLQVTLFRPSVIFGREDRFINLFAKLARLLPVLFLGCPSARFQPIFVEDVARAFTESLGNPDTFGQAYDLCGPKVYTLRELVNFVADTIGHRPLIVELGDTLSYLQAWSLEWLPGKLMTRDNYLSMKVDSVCGCDFPEILGFKPVALEAVAPEYLAGQLPRGCYQRFRGQARRNNP